MLCRRWVAVGVFLISVGFQLVARESRTGLIQEEKERPESDGDWGIEPSWLGFQVGFRVQLKTSDVIHGLWRHTVMQGMVKAAFYESFATVCHIEFT